jgi:putative hydroxymethylpyrimidine transport system substrate-binding protein
MMLNWVPNPEHVALFYALDRGYFADEGLNLEVQTPGNATDTMKLVATNRADLGISFEPALFIANEQGLPVTAVETSVPVPLDSLIALPESGIQSPSDLAGKKVGNDGLPNDEAVYQTALKTGGLTPDQVTEVQVGFNLVTSLLSHKVDAIVGGFRNVEAIQIEQETGEKPVVLSADQLGVPSYSEDVIIANADRLASDSDYAELVRRFTAGLARGIDGVARDEAGAVKVMQDHTEDTPAFLKASVPFTISLLAPPNGQKAGCLDEANWQNLGDWMKGSDLIKEQPDASTVMTNDYMPYACA